MGITLAIYHFEGPLESVSSIKEAEGLFAVLCLEGNNTYSLLHVEEANNLRAKIRNHNNLKIWTKMCDQKLAFGVNYTPNLQILARKMMVDDIKNSYSMNDEER